MIAEGAEKSEQQIAQENAFYAACVNGWIQTRLHKANHQEESPVSRILQIEEIQKRR